MWLVEIDRGSAADFHQRDLPADIQPSLWWFEVERPALVLGSGQPIEHIDVRACEQAGIEIVRRRSGGGAVLLEPDDVLWVDVLIPFGHPMWTPDVTSSAWWLGEMWHLALGSLGMVGTEVHRGPLRHTTWSRHVCFAGTGGGELTLGERKVVGISQRRTRAGVRLQCALYRHWRPENHVALFSAPGPTVDDLCGIAAAVALPVSEIRRAVADALNNLSSSSPARRQ